MLQPAARTKIRRADGAPLPGAAMAPSPPISRGLVATLLPAQAAQALIISLLAPVVPGIATFLASTGSAAQSAQIVVVAPFLGLMVGSLASGPLIRLAGLRRLALIAAALFAAGGVGGLLASGLVPLLVTCVVTGFAAAMLVSDLSAVTSVLYAEAVRGRMVGFQSATANLLAIVLGLISAFLAERLGWRVSFGAFTCFGGLMLLLIAVFVPGMAAADAVPVKVGGVLRMVWPVCLAGAAVFVIASSQSTQLPFLLDKTGISSAGMRAVVATVTSVFALMGSLTFGYSQARVSRRALIAVAGAFGTAGWVLFGLWTGGVAVALVAAALIGVGIGLVLPALYTSAMHAAPGEASGLSVGLLNASIFLGSFANPLLTAPLAGLSLSRLMIAMSVLTLLTTLVACAWRRSVVVRPG